MKYMGSKLKIREDIIPIILKNIDNYNNYIEPFCGGLSIIEKVDGIMRYAYDINPFLISMWKCLQYFEDEYGYEISLIDYLLDKDIITYNDNKFFISKEMYDFHRNHYNRIKKEKYNPEIINDYGVIGFVGYMASFNGRFYDGGYSGIKNGRNYPDEQIRNIIRQIPLLYDIEFDCKTFDETYNMICNKTNVNNIIYCDPPYKNTKQYAYSTKFDYNNFYEKCIDLAKRGHQVFISEYEMPKEYFKCVWEKEKTNSMSLKNTYKPTERLFIPNF